MIALDTNLLLRFVLEDDAQLASAARRLIQQSDCWINLVTAAEVGRVLLSVYGSSRDEVVDAMRRLISQPNIEFESEQRLEEALTGVEAGLDWDDALLWAATPPNLTVMTFDKVFAKRAAILGWKVESRLPKAGA